MGYGKRRGNWQGRPCGLAAATRNWEKVRALKALGYSISRTAKELGLSERTVWKHRKFDAPVKTRGRRRAPLALSAAEVDEAIDWCKAGVTGAEMIRRFAYRGLVLTRRQALRLLREHRIQRRHERPDKTRCFLPGARIEFDFFDGPRVGERQRRTRVLIACECASRNLAVSVALNWNSDLTAIHCVDLAMQLGGARFWVFDQGPEFCAEPRHFDAVAHAALLRAAARHAMVQFCTPGSPWQKARVEQAVLRCQRWLAGCMFSDCASVVRYIRQREAGRRLAARR